MVRVRHIRSAPRKRYARRAERYAERAAANSKMRRTRCRRRLPPHAATDYDVLLIRRRHAAADTLLMLFSLFRVFAEIAFDATRGAAAPRYAEARC